MNEKIKVLHHLHRTLFIDDDFFKKIEMRRPHIEKIDQINYKSL